VSEENRALNQPSGASEHLDEMTCLLYIERQLDRARGQEVSAHTQECAPCRTLLKALERESRLLTRSLLEEDEALPSRLAQFQERARRSMQWIWGIVVGLAATGVYALYSGYVAPWQQQLEQAGFGGTNLLGLLIFQGAFWKGWQSVMTLFEVLAVLTLAGFAMMIFRRRSRRGYILAILLASLISSAALAGPASATEFRKGQTTETVTSDEVIHGDIYLTGERARVDGTVEGDVFVFAQSAEINGHVKGDVIAFAHTTRITGQVDGNIRAFNNTLTITGTVNKNVMAFAESVELDAAGKVGGSFTGFLNNPILDGQIGGDVLLFDNHTSINGKIAGSVQAKGESFSVGPKGEIGGHIKYEGNKEPEVSSQAKLASPVEFKKQVHTREYTATSYLWQAIWAAALVLFGLVLFLLMPAFSHEAVANAERYGASFGLGVLVMFGVPIAAIITCVTVVGLFIGISTLFVWYAALYFAQVVVGGLVGQWLLGRTSEAWPVIGRMILGLLLLRVCTAVPHIGGWVKFAVILWGLGAISLAIYRRFQPLLTPGGSAPVPAPYVPPPLPPNTTVGGIQSA
jgi:cytoskeletal protein CcmA (bactofilin family)